MYGEKCVGAIVCKLDIHKKVVRRGYIAMLAVDEKYRQEKIGTPNGGKKLNNVLFATNR